MPPAQVYTAKCTQLKQEPHAAVALAFAQTVDRKLQLHGKRLNMGSRIDDSALLPIAAALKDDTSVSYLDLRCNSLSDASADTVAKLLQVGPGRWRERKRE